MNLLSEYRRMLAFIDPKVDTYVSTQDYRCIVAAALYDVANEHAKGICTLYENKHDASAFALTRCLFETFVRGAWLQHCATDSELDTFVQKDKIELETRERFTFGHMVKAVEEKLDWPATLSEIKDRVWEALNSYTHGGQFQVTRRFDGNTVQPHHDPEQVEEFIKFSAFLTFLIFCQFSLISGTKEMDIHVQELYEQVSPWCLARSEAGTT